MGLKQGQDLENRAAHHYQEFPRVPLPPNPPFTLRDEALRTSKCPLQSYINYYHDYLKNDLKRFPRSKGFRIRIHIKIPPRFHIVSQSVARILYLLLVLYPVCGPKSAVRSRCFTLTAFHSTKTFQKLETAANGTEISQKSFQKFRKLLDFRNASHSTALYILML